MRRVVRFVTFAVALGVAAPAAAQNREHQQMFADLRMLQEQVQQLRLTVNTLAEAVKTIATKQDEQANAVRKSFADQKVQTDVITDSIRILREKSDDTNVRIATAAHEVETLRQAVQQLQGAVTQAMAQPASSTPPVVTAGDTGAPPAGQSAVAPPTVTQSADALWKGAYGDYIVANYNLAIPGFEAFIRSFPTSPQAAQAQFYIGESHFNLGSFGEAVRDYSAVITNFKGSSYEADAFFKRGKAYEQLNQKDRAKADYQTVMSKFPDSALAPLAKSAFDGIKQDTPATPISQ